MESISELIGQRVQIYPGDSSVKIGIIEHMTPAGILFKITASESKSYTVGALHWISYSANLSYELLEAQA